MPCWVKRHHIPCSGGPGEPRGEQSSDGALSGVSVNDPPKGRSVNDCGFAHPCADWIRPNQSANDTGRCAGSSVTQWPRRPGERAPAARTYYSWGGGNVPQALRNGHTWTSRPGARRWCCCAEPNHGEPEPVCGVMARTRLTPSRRFDTTCRPATPDRYPETLEGQLHLPSAPARPLARTLARWTT